MPPDQMLDFFQFWWRCILTGWQVGHGIVAVIGTITFLISGFLQLHEKGKEHVGKVERWTKIITFWIFLACLIVLPVFFAPYLEYRKADKLNPKYDDRVVVWHSPEIAAIWKQVYICPGGVFISPKTFQYQGSLISLDINKMTNSDGFMFPIAGYPVTMVSKIIKNCVVIDLNIPTGKRPIQIRDGQSVEELPDGWDWNSDVKAFEIVDDQDQPVFQEIYQYTNCLWLRGQVEDQGALLNLGPQLDSEPLTEYEHRNDLQMNAIFKYPASKYKGQRR
jgi:hypothetical protein